MNRSRFRLSLRNVLIAVALAAMLFGLIRGSNGAAWMNLALCTTAIAALWLRDALALRREQGLSTGRVRRLGLILTALVVSTLIVGLSNLAFLVAFKMGPELWNGRSASRFMLPMNLGLISANSAHGLLFGMLTAFALRRALWMYRRPVMNELDLLKRFGPLLALGLLALILFWRRSGL